jgi:hypothetical protein
VKLSGGVKFISEETLLPLLINEWPFPDFFLPLKDSMSASRFTTSCCVRHTSEVSRDS